MASQQPAQTKAERLAVATRFWATAPTDIQQLQAFIERAVTYADVVLVAINEQQDRHATTKQLQAWLLTQQQRAAEDTAQSEQLLASWSGVHILSLHVWHGVSLALNALLCEAAAKQCSIICYQSVEIATHKQHVDAMRALLERGVTSDSQARASDPLLAVGACLDGAHDFQPGVNALNGRTVPWNTFCMYDVPTLLLTGWLTVSDGLAAGMEYGVEEVPTLTLLMQLLQQQQQRAGAQHPTHAAKRRSIALLQLTSSPPLMWLTNFEAQPLRQQWQQKKLESKLHRAEAHMQLLGIEAGQVYHVTDR